MALDKEIVEVAAMALQNSSGRSWAAIGEAARDEYRLDARVALAAVGFEQLREALEACDRFWSRVYPDGLAADFSRGGEHELWDAVRSALAAAPVPA